MRIPVLTHATDKKRDVKRGQQFLFETNQKALPASEDVTRLKHLGRYLLTISGYYKFTSAAACNVIHSKSYSDLSVANTGVHCN